MKMQATPPQAARGRGEAKREAILAAAKTLFLEAGFEASVDSIAAEAGVSKQTIYSHFGSKEGLFRAMADWLKRPLADELDPSRPPEEALAAFGRETLARVVTEPLIRLNRLLISQAGQFPDLAALHYEIGPGRTMEFVAAYVRGLVERGFLRPCDPEAAAGDFIALLVGNIRHRLLLGCVETPNDAAVDRIARHATAVFLAAYRAPPALS